MMSPKHFVVRLYLAFAKAVSNVSTRNGAATGPFLSAMHCSGTSFLVDVR